MPSIIYHRVAPSTSLPVVMSTPRPSDAPFSGRVQEQNMVRERFKMFKGPQLVKKNKKRPKF